MGKRITKNFGHAFINKREKTVFCLSSTFSIFELPRFHQGTDDNIMSVRGWTSVD